ncbi:tyrosine-type recombinase/integrase [Gilliamella mensalis]|uniref:tyrosine-type recombinase/integrase n=1 Tax=Gilliamella mensalis TaxID=1908520 RepID=UPI000A14A33D|nr:site-specific integrase [Gilliamella mensalis]
MILTDSKIKGLKPRGKDYYSWHDTETKNTGRIGIRVFPSGRKVFVFRYYENKKAKFVNLGDYPVIMLAEAINKSQQILSNLNKKESNLVTLSQLFTDYVNNMKSTGKRSWGTTENRLNQVLDSKFIDGNKAAKDITSTDIKLMLSEVINRGALAGANKIRAAVHAAFNYGLKADNDPANIRNSAIYGLDLNPVTVVPKQQGVEKAGDRFLSWAELKELIDDCNKPLEESVIHPDFRILTLLCIYTAGQRPWELIANIWDNVDLNNKELTIPPELSKMKNFHVVPLCETILQKLKEIKSDKGFIFPSKTKSGHLETSEFGKQIRKYCKRKNMQPFTPRDIRRTFKTLAGAMGISSEMRDRLQNHKMPGVSSKHYDRYDYWKEKQELISTWEQKINSI